MPPQFGLVLTHLGCGPIGSSEPGADLHDCGLHHVDLSNASSYNADLSDANLRYTNLSDASLYGANLRA